MQKPKNITVICHRCASHCSLMWTDPHEVYCTKNFTLAECQAYQIEVQNKNLPQFTQSGKRIRMSYDT